MQPNILDFLNSQKIEVFPHEVEPYLEFDGNHPNASKSVVIVKSRQMRATEFCKNVGLFDAICRNENSETVLHVFPRQQMAGRFSKERLLPELVKPYTFLSAMYNPNNGRSNDVYEFGHDASRRYIVMSGGSADSLHGIRGDLLIRDEVNMFSEDGISNTDTPLSVSKHPASLDIGTPAGNDYLKHLWQQSDKRKYFYCCTACGEYFQPTMELLCGIRDVKCPNCEKEQDKLAAAKDGKWVTMRNPRGQVCRVGYHFTQLINPLVETVQMLRWRDEFSPGQFKAQVLGEI
jgi:phage terminase large subunit GpA-like protein